MLLRMVRRFPALLLPDPFHLEVRAISADEDPTRLVISLKTNQPGAICPLCKQASEHIHSYYQRTLADLPWANLEVKLRVRVRRFFCHTEDCPRWIFTERLPQVARPWARRTIRLADLQGEIALAVGASMGRRLAKKLNMSASVDVLLCLVRQTEGRAWPPVRVLGVDDWAIRKGRTYGTILVDLEKGEVIDLLPDRRAETLAAWLKTHPEVEIISRDRAGAYAEGANQGAPDAVQVADRWHLLHNLGDALVRVLERFQRPLKTLSQTTLEAETGRTPTTEMPVLEAVSAEIALPSPDKKPRPGILERRQRQRAERLARFEEVRALRERGATISAIARKLGLDRKTVRNFVRADTFPERQASPKRGSILDPYKPYLRQRWQEGCRTAAKLWREVQTLGYQGGRIIVVDFVAQIRQEQGLPPRTHMLTAQADRQARLTPRTATWVILKRPDQIEAQDRALIQRLRTLDPDIDGAITLAQDFARIIRNHLLKDFDPWLSRTTSSSITALRNFASSIESDYEAVRAAISTDWSNGQTEGQVNRLKFIKRQMFGRAHFDLLRKRVLYAW
jgi:transposase